MPDSRAVTEEFSHSPVSWSGQSTPINIIGKTSAVETEIIEAGIGLSTATIKLWVAKENQRVI